MPKARTLDWTSGRSPGRQAIAAALFVALAPAAGTARAQDAAAAGFRIINDRALGNCTACHGLPGQAGLSSDFGPSLDGVSRRLDAVALRQWVTDARLIRPDTLMPPFGTTQGTHRADRERPTLTADEIALVVAALQTLR